MIRTKVPAQKITVVLHNTAVSRSAANLQRQSVVTTHRNKWNFPSELNGSPIGYNFFCEATGHRTQERFIGEETIAQVGKNWDVPERGGYISYCMAGYFAVEKPTQMQVDDFKAFIAELREAGFEVEVVVQHKDVQVGRTCAELSADDIQNLFTIEPDKETPTQKIKRLEAEVAAQRDMIKQLTGMVTLLIKILSK